MKMIKLMFVAAMVAVASGCAVVASPVGNGMLVTAVSGPVTVTTNEATEKTGRACAFNVLGLFAGGQAGIEHAKANGQITKVASVDHDSLRVLGLFSQFCTVVHGS